MYKLHIVLNMSQRNSSSSIRDELPENNYRIILVHRKKATEKQKLKEQK